MVFSKRHLHYLSCALSAFMYCIAGGLSSRAEEPTKDPGSIKLSVRTIHASNPLDSEEPKPSGDAAIHLDTNLRDIEGKLAQLPFGNFQLLSAREEVITLKTRDSLKLPNGHSLTFRPMYIDAKKVGLWLNWRDEDGSEILNTRVHFDSSDSVLTGTDYAHDKGLILAIKASAIPR